MRTPTLDDQAVTEAHTRPTESIADAQLHDVLVVDGPFGWSGVYPLDLAQTRQDGLCVRHCNLYYLRFAIPAQVREKAAVVVDRTHYRLADGDVQATDEDLCARCLNRACPPNRNPAASVDTLPAGKLVLAL